MGTPPLDIFATKGVEYIFAVGFLLTLIFFWRILYPPKKPAASAPAPVKSGYLLNSRFRLAEGFLYHPCHTWVLPEKHDVVRIGVDDFTQQLLGRPCAIDLPRIGTRMTPGEIGWKLLVDSKAIGILSPVEGEVIAVNDEAVRNPSLVNRDPYGNGWLITVRVPNMDAILKNLMSGNRAAVWMKETADALGRSAGDSSVDIFQAVPLLGIARILYPDNWHEIAEKFLSADCGLSSWK